MFAKLKQFKDLRDQAKKIQSALAEENITAETLGGKIKLTMDGNLGIASINIDPELLSPDKKEKLEAGIRDAHGEALKKIQKIMALKMRDMGGMPNIPGINS